MRVQSGLGERRAEARAAYAVLADPSQHLYYSVDPTTTALQSGRFTGAGESAAWPEATPERNVVE